MANRPANAGSGRGLAPIGNAAPPLDTVAPPPQAAPPRAAAPPQAAPPQAVPPRPEAPRSSAGHRAARSRESRSARDGNDPVAWLIYLIVLAGVAAGMFTAWQGSRYAGRGAALVGCSLLAAGLARLILPPRYAGLLVTRRKAFDVLAFAVFGAAVLAVAIALP
jgi:hypothetical protein